MQKRKNIRIFFAVISFARGVPPTPDKAPSRPAGLARPVFPRPVAGVVSPGLGRVDFAGVWGRTSNVLPLARLSPGLPGLFFGVVRGSDIPCPIPRQSVAVRDRLPASPGPLFSCFPRLCRGFWEKTGKNTQNFELQKIYELKKLGGGWCHYLFYFCFFYQN